MRSVRLTFCAATVFCGAASYGALTNMDYANETWRLVWDGTPVSSLPRNEKTYFYCHWESSLGRRMAADIHVCESSVNVIKHSGAVQALEPTEYGPCTYWIMRTDYSVPFDDIKRVYSIIVGGSSSGGGSSSVHHAIEKPNLYVYSGTTNMLISWSIGKQTDNSPIKAEIYRCPGSASSSEASYELVYAEYDPSNIRVTNGPANDNEWVDTSVKLGVTYTYFVRVYGQGGSIDYSNSYATTGKTTGGLLFYEGLKGATHNNPDYYVTSTRITNPPSSIPGYTFEGWTPESVQAGSGSQVITANWRAHKYTVRYNANGGLGAAVEYPAEYGKSFTIRSNEWFSKSGHVFTGWARRSDGIAEYWVGRSVQNLTSGDNEVVNLYAVWKSVEDDAGRVSDISVETTEESGKFRINYTLSNTINAQDYGLKFLHVTDGQTNEIASLEGEIPLTAGENSVVWNVELDGVLAGHPGEVIIAIVGVGAVGNVIANDRFNAKAFCIVNLSGSEKWSVQYTNAIPEGGWTTDHKGNKLVLKRLHAGNYTPNGRSVVLTKDFYIGVFEVTETQYLKVMGINSLYNPSYHKYYSSTDVQYIGTYFPVETVSYDDIRGANKGVEWPQSSDVDDGSFMGILRANTGLLFDLPTLAQWQYACLAGTTTAYSYGDEPNGQYMWYEGNSGQYDSVAGVTVYWPREVGTKRPNPWGLYDMHGNIEEWCLDHTYPLQVDSMYGEDPVGPPTSSSSGSTSGRRAMGGSYRDDSTDCRSRSYDGYDQNSRYAWVGFRVALTDISNEPEYVQRTVAIGTASFVKPEPPTFSSDSGTIFESSLSLSISCPTEDATIHYTTNGSIPTAESPEYRRFRITGKTTVKAVAVVGGMLSDIVTAEYAMGQCATPTISLADGEEFSHSNQVVAIQWNDDGVLRYTLDGSEPTAENPIYDGPFTINDSTTIKAKVFSDTFFDSPVVTASVTRVWENMTPPVIGVAATFTGTRTEVVISNEMDGAIIFYTLDGSEPNSQSAKYTEPFYVTDSCTIKAYAVMPDYLDSVVVTVVVTRAWETVATPQIEAAASFTGSKAKVTLSCATDGALVRYTLNGNDPNSHSTKYTKPFYVTDSCTIKAYAVKADYLNSAIATQAIVKAWGIGDTMGKPDHAFSTSGLGGGTGFVRVSDATAPDGEAMKSGAITHSQSSILSTTVMGAGTLAFSWRTSCEEDPLHEWDHAEFIVDGNVRLVLDGVTSWQNESVRIEGSGEHAVEWKYVKDDVESEGEDAAWVAGYHWTPDVVATRTTIVPVPYEWLTDHDPDVVDEYASYENSAKAKVADLNEESLFYDKYYFISEKMQENS